jgi:hypothetical protein
MGLTKFPSSSVSKGFSPSGITGLSGAVSTLTLNGPVVASQFCAEALSARIATTLFTNGLQALVKWQVLDDDGVTYIDCVQTGNLANVAVNTGAGTSGGTVKNLMVTAPTAIVAGNRPFRAVITAAGSGPGAGLGFDTASISYDFRAPVTPYG